MDRQQVRESLTGPVASVRTPFNQDGGIDFAGLRNYVEFCISAGSRSIVLTYGDSLYSVLTDDEIAEVTKVVVEQSARRAMVVAADRQWATPKEVAFARYAREAGADLLMVLPPDWAASGTCETLVQHYAAVAREIPVMAVTGIFLARGAAFGLDVLKTLADRVPGVVAVKDDFCGEFARKMALLVHDRFAIFSGGQKQNHLDVWPYGCDGYLSTFITFRPEVAHAYWSAIQRNDIRSAVRVIARFDMPYFDHVMKLPGGFDAGMHGVLEVCGIAKRWRRPPYYSLSDAEMEQLAAFVRGLDAAG